MLLDTATLKKNCKGEEVCRRRTETQAIAKLHERSSKRASTSSVPDRIARAVHVAMQLAEKSPLKPID